MNQFNYINIFAWKHVPEFLNIDYFENIPFLKRLDE